MRGRSLFDPGPLRGWWWRSSQRQRLTVVGAGAAISLTLLAGALLDVPASVPHGSAPFPVTTAPPHAAPGTGMTTSGWGDPPSGGATAVTDGPSKVDTSGSAAPPTDPTSATT